jgi:uncharacterized coiled-coil DUF342 family protein
MANVKKNTTQIRAVRDQLMHTLKELREKIAALETEKAKLISEVDDLRKAAEARVTTLESEVGQIRLEAKSLRALLIDKPTAPNAASVEILPSSN